MDARERTRLIVTHSVLRMARTRDFRNTLFETSSSGEHVIIPALPDDPMGYFFEQLRIADGPVYIAVLDGNDISVVAMAPRRHAKHAALPAQDDCPIHPDSEILMLLEYLRQCPGPITCYEAAPSIMFELVDDGRQKQPTMA